MGNKGSQPKQLTNEKKLRARENWHKFGKTLSEEVKKNGTTSLQLIAIQYWCKCINESRKDTLLNLKKRLEKKESISEELESYLIEIMATPSSDTKQIKKCEVLKVLTDKVNEQDLTKFLNKKNHNGLTFIARALTYYIANEEYRDNIEKSSDFLQYILKLIEFGADCRSIVKLKELYDNTKVNSANIYYNKELECFHTICSELKKGIELSEKLNQGKKYQFITFIEGIISNDNPLLTAVLQKNAKKFTTLLKDWSISDKYSKGNNLLHSITLLPGESKIECLKFVLANVTQDDEIRNTIKDINSKGLTPIQVLLSNKINSEHSIIKSIIPAGKNHTNTLKCALILLKEYGADVNDLKFDADEKGKKTYHELLTQLKEFVENSIESEAFKKDIARKVEYVVNDGLPLHSAIRNEQEDLFKAFLSRGHDPSIQDENGNNILHEIAKRKGEKTTWFNFVKEGVIDTGDKSLLEKFESALNAKNKSGFTPMQVALCRKIEKSTNQPFLKALNPSPNNYTAEFCIQLLQSGAGKEQLTSLKDPLKSKKYCKIIEKIEKELGPQIPNNIRNELNNRFPKKTEHNPGKSKWVIGGLVGFTIFGVLVDNNLETKVILLCVMAVCLACYFVYSKLTSFSLFKASEPLKIITDCNVDPLKDVNGMGK